MYAIAITPLIRSLEVKQVWFADDATAGGGLASLRRWWDLMVERGPAYGYYPNSTKTCLVAKEESIKMAKKEQASLSQKRARGCYWDSSFC